MKKIFLFLLFTVLGFSEIYVDGLYKFSDDKGNTYNFKGKKFIVVDLYEGQGYLYAYNKDGSLAMKIKITGGPFIYKTPDGIYPIIQKKKYHMSKEFPSENGKNNMDDMLKLTKSGIALHKGSTKYFSHGCVHVDPKMSGKLFKWADYKTKVIVTSDFYGDHVEEIEY